MDFPGLTISPDATRATLTDLINEFIRIEKSTTGFRISAEIKLCSRPNIRYHVLD